MAADGEQQEVLIVTGMSGAGRSTVGERARGPRLVRRRQPAAADAAPAGRARRACGRLACRASPPSSTCAAATSSPSCSEIDPARCAAAPNVRVVFLDATDAVLVRRFESVRRPHPLQGDGTLLDGIGAERARLAEIREASDIVIDTSDLNIHQLATAITETFAEDGPAGVQVTMMSFGFKYGAARGCRPRRRRALPAEPVLGSGAPARSPASTPEVARLRARASRARASSSTRYAAALEPVLAGYQRENKRHATIAIGCTGGKHRSVAIAEELAAAAGAAPRRRREREAPRPRSRMTRLDPTYRRTTSQQKEHRLALTADVKEELATVEVGEDDRAGGRARHDPALLRRAAPHLGPHRGRVRARLAR